jgi:hypothetical protein
LEEGPVDIKAAKQEAAQANISARSLERAAKQLGLKTVYTVVDGKRLYKWSLPDSA